MTTATRATVEDLYAFDGKAELIQAELVVMPPTGDMPNRGAGSIFASLLSFERKTKSGRAYTDNIGYAVRLPHRESFSPDASFFTGASTGMRFLEGAPAFAVEVRSENDYGDSAERAMAQKRADYFAVGTLVVWDVDLLSTEVIRSYRADMPYTPIIFKRNEIANAEPAVPDWTFAVNELFY